MSLLRRLPQPARLGLAALLLVAGVATWYAVFQRNQAAAEIPSAPAATTAPTTTPPAQSESPSKPLEVVPVPFMVTEAPADTAKPKAEKPVTAKPAPAVVREKAPPNPFVPLVLAAPPKPPGVLLPPSTTASSPIAASPTKVQVRQPSTPLTAPSTPKPVEPEPKLAPTPVSATVPGQTSLGASVLPIRLNPLEREVAPTQSELKPVQPTQPVTPAETSLAKFVREKGIKLAGAVLGPTSVGVFQTKAGFLVVPVGRTFPDADVLLKSLSADEALLVQGEDTLTLQIKTP